MAASELDEGRGSPGQFRTTSWSLVACAAEQDESRAHHALEGLCRMYWSPVWVFIIRRGYTPTDAKDLTQGFFERLLEKGWLRTADESKGRFRTFLLTAVSRFLAQEREKRNAMKRGGGQFILSLDAGEMGEGGIGEPAVQDTPETSFERRWAETLLDRVLERLEAEFNRNSGVDRFKELKGFLTNDPGVASYAEVGLRLGLSESAVKSGIYRMRQRYAELVREEIAETVASPKDVEAEIRHLLAVMSS